jgi:hypothetical protein
MMTINLVAGELGRLASAIIDSVHPFVYLRGVER